MLALLRYHFTRRWFYDGMAPHMVALANYTVLKTHDRAALSIISGLRDDYAMVLLDHLLEA